MSVIQEFDLDLDDLQACLSQWMAASSVANEDLEQKNQHLSTLEGGIQRASAGLAGLLAEVDQHRETFRQTASQGEAEYLELSSKLRQGMEEAGAARDQQSRGSVEQLGQTLETCKGLIQSNLLAQSQLTDQVAQVSKISDQGRDQLVELDKSADRNLDEVNKTTREMQVSLEKNGDSSARNVGQLTKFLDESGRVKVPDSSGKVSSWLVDVLVSDQLKILEGVFQGADAGLSGFKQKVGATLLLASQGVSAALTTASTDIHTARQAANQQYNNKSLPRYQSLLEDQKEVFDRFKAAGQKTAEVGQKLGEIRGKYEAVARNVPW